MQSTGKPFCPAAIGAAGVPVKVGLAIFAFKAMLLVLVAMLEVLVLIAASLNLAVVFVSATNVPVVVIGPPVNPYPVATFVTVPVPPVAEIV